PFHPNFSLLSSCLQPKLMSASGTKEVIGVLGKSVTFHTPNTDANPAFWNFGNEAIVTVAFEDPPRPLFSEEKFKTRFAVSERGRALTISQLRMEDAGTYSVKIDKKRSTFTLQVFRELAEPTVTCEAQNCSDGSCSSSLRCSTSGTGFGNVSYTWRVRDQDMDGSSVVLQVNETFQDGLEPVTCTAWNPVSSKSITITNLGQLCAGENRGQVGKGGHVPDGTKAKPAEGGPPSTIYSLVKRPEQVSWEMEPLDLGWAQRGPEPTNQTRDQPPGPQTELVSVCPCRWMEGQQKMPP
uniref:Ig-like domain-containing protein n=1 Tax=Zonotrichia albicollis TaxID=44394 RepID=A0A8D2M3S4_ZONAL